MTYSIAIEDEVVVVGSVAAGDDDVGNMKGD